MIRRLLPRDLGGDASRDLWIVLGGELLSSIGTGLTLPFLLVYLHHVRGLDPTLAALAVSAVAAAGFVGNPLGGWCADRAGARNTFCAGLLVASAGGAWLAFVADATTALAAAGVLGLGGAVMFPARNALLATLVAPAGRSAIFSLQQMVRNGGFGAGAVLSATIVDLSSTRTFQLIYLLDAATFVAFALLVTRIREPRRAPAEPAPDGTRDGYRAVLADGRFVRLWLLMAVIVITGFAQFQAAFPAYATGPAGLGAKVLAIGFAVNTLAVVALQVPVLQLANAARRTRGLVVACGFVAAAWGATLAAAPAGAWAAAPLFVVAMLLLAVAETLIAPTAPPLVNDLAPDRLRGRYNGAFTLVFTAGFVVGPALSGVAFDAGRMHELFGAFVVVCALAAALAIDLERRLPDAVNRIGGPGADGPAAPDEEVVPPALGRRRSAGDSRAATPS